MTFLPFKRSESDVARHYSINMKEPMYIEYIGDKPTPGCMRQINVGSVSSISLSSDGNRVPSGSPSGVCLWDVDSGELIRGPFGGDASVSYCSRDRVLVVNRDGDVDEWSAYTCKRMHGLPTVDIGRVTSVSSGLWRYYATGFEDGAIQLWDREQKTAIGESLKGHSGKVLALAFGESGDNCLASGSEDQSIIIWDVEIREKKHPPLKGHSGPVTSVVLTKWQGELVSGSLDGTVRLWSVSTGDMLYPFSASEMGGVYSVASFKDDGHILSGSEDGIIRMWDTNHKEVPPKKFVGHTGKVTSLAMDYSNRGRRFASGSEDGTICIWDTEGKRQIDSGYVIALAASPNGEYIVAGMHYGAVSVWRIETGELVLPPRNGGRVTSVSFSPDGFHFASGSEDGTVRIWDLNGGSVTCSTEGQQVWAVCFSPDGKHLASSATNTIRVWDSESGELALNPFEGHSELVKSICYSPDGKRIVSGSDDTTIRIWDAPNGTLLLTWKGDSETITSVKYSHDSSFIISASLWGTVRFWDANNGKPVREPFNKQEFFRVGAYSFNHKELSFSQRRHGETSFVWETSTNVPLFGVKISSSFVSIVFLPSSDGKYTKFASASNEDGLIHIYCVDIDSRGKISDAPDDDGWIIGNDGNLISWVPSDIRRTLIYGSCFRILNTQLSTKLTLSKYQGSRWTSCFPSSSII